MKRLIPLIIVGACVLLAGCGGQAATPAAPAVPMTTLTLQVASGMGGVDSKVAYTCAEGTTIKTCEETGIKQGQIWEKQVSVPTGTTVRVQAVGGGVILPSCYIYDAEKKLRLDGGAGQNRCETKAE